MRFTILLAAMLILPAPRPRSPSRRPPRTTSLPTSSPPARKCSSNTAPPAMA